MYECQATRVVVTDIAATTTLSVTWLPNPTQDSRNTPTYVCFLYANLQRNCALGIVFSKNSTKNLSLLCSNVLFPPVLELHPDSSTEVALLIAKRVIARALLCCYLSGTKCRCGWDLTSIGFLMTELFVRWSLWGRLMCGRKLLWWKIGLRAGPGCSPAVLQLSFCPRLSPFLPHSIP